MTISKLLRRLFAIILLFAAGPALAQSTATYVVPGYLTTSGCPTSQTSCFVPYGPSQAIQPVAIIIPTAPLGFQLITSLSASTALTVPTGATVAVIVSESQGVRWRDDGTPPTASVGFPLAAAQPMTYRGNLSLLRFIQQAASATLDITYY